MVGLPPGFDDHFLVLLLSCSFFVFRELLLPFESMQGVRGGKEGTDFRMNLRPLLIPPEEPEPSL